MNVKSGLHRGLIVAALSLVVARAATAWRFEECVRISAPTASALAERGRDCMSHGDRAVAPSMFEADKKAIEAAYHEVKASNERTGAKDGDILGRFAHGWVSLRWDDQRTPLTLEHVAQSGGYGRLALVSEPDGATVYVNGDRWPEPTNSKEWTQEGSKRITLKRKGCKDMSAEATVRAGYETVFDRKLECTRQGLSGARSVFGRIWPDTAHWSALDRQ